MFSQRTHKILSLVNKNENEIKADHEKITEKRVIVESISDLPAIYPVQDIDDFVPLQNPVLLDLSSAYNENYAQDQTTNYNMESVQNPSVPDFSPVSGNHDTQEEPVNDKENEWSNQGSESSEPVSDDRDVDFIPEDHLDSSNDDGYENGETFNENRRSKKRIRKMNLWKQNIRHEKKRKGEAYITKKGKTKRAKTLQQACNCKRKCFNLIGEDLRKRIFDSFYIMDRHAQDQFLSATVDEDKKHRQRLEPGKTKSRRQYSKKYYLKNEQGNRTEVCQKMYLATFDITIKKIRIICEKKRNNGGILLPDARGRHSQHRRMAEAQKDFIRNHIETFPAYSSHYSRQKSGKKYLSPDLSIALLYRLYCKSCEENKMSPQSEFYYRKIFNEEFNLSFHHPANDTCQKCDRIAVALKSFMQKPNLGQEDVQQKLKLETEKNVHLDMAEKAYKCKANDKNQSKEDSTHITCSFDLEKCLPTPYLRNGQSFYKRQLWVYNLTVYKTDTKGSTGICFLWNETIAIRGGQEIASCIRKFLLSLNPEVKTITFYSDSCSGQNRNIYMALMFCCTIRELARNSSIIEINHKFMEPGHTHMEADTIHAAIETAKKKTTADIELPHDWCNFIRSVYRKRPLEVIDMSQEDFLNFQQLLTSSLVHRKKDEEGNPVPWLQIKWMQYKRELEFRFNFKTNFEDGPFKTVDLRRGAVRTRKDNINISLTALNNQPLPIADVKAQHLIDLLPFISEYNREFYLSITGSCDLDPEDIPDVQAEEADI